jgi:ATP-dependent Lon protease
MAETATLSYKLVMGSTKNERANQIFLRDIINSETDFLPIIADGDDVSLHSLEVPEILPILPLRNTVLFPGVVIPITVGRQKSLKLIQEVHRGNKLLGTIAQVDFKLDDPGTGELFGVGTMAEVLKLLEMPDGTTTVIIQGRRRFRIREFIAEDPYFMARVEALTDIVPETNNEFTAVVGSLKDLSIKIAQFTANIPPEASFAVKNIENSTFLINYICSNTDIEVKEKQQLLEIDNLLERGMQAIGFLVKEVQMLELKRDIQSKVKTDMDKQQREYMLHQQMKTIQDELGGNPVEKEIKELKEKGRQKSWSDTVGNYFGKEVDKLSRLNPAAGEYSVQYSYCQTLLELPWNEYTEDNFDLEHARKVLDEDHFGLEKVKERILEHLAVLKLKNDLKAPILCLHGPPGVGKTSLGKSIARALGRKFIRMSLGGLHDESEIRDTEKPISVQCREELFRTSKRHALQIPSLYWTRSTRCQSSFTETLLRLCWRYWIRSKTVSFTIITSTLIMI